MVVALELDDLDGLFQLKPFCDSRILLSYLFLFLCLFAFFNQYTQLYSYRV